MRLLVTRPEPEATRTAERLRALGHEPVMAPLLEAIFLDPPQPAFQPAAILLTSGNGLRGLLRWSFPASWFDVPVFAVGDRTAEAARDAGFSKVLSANGDGDALATLAIATLAPGAGTLLYPAAVDRAGNWPERLIAGGHALFLVEVYRMDPAANLPDSVANDLRQRRIDGVLLYSPRTAKTFVQLVAGLNPQPPVDDLPIYTLSETIASMLTFGAVFIAAEPTDDALLAQIPKGMGTSPSGVR
ncbi:uroporphyrinogen-III synthase [Kaistia terrae]|uniref:Uroporphyrinogen-III synthase n=1 Tax=Kaistia terrae TaxID=537017 RepID=A0ABW0PYM5_9HYPH|nr:uroporphyrinogen-III synthase [Kaistia terrae]MCX5580908.1 uroporphyrinogen-III synthase [Kaistia terrae]